VNRRIMKSNVGPDKKRMKRTFPELKGEGVIE